MGSLEAIKGCVILNLQISQLRGRKYRVTIKSDPDMD